MDNYVCEMMYRSKLKAHSWFVQLMHSSEYFIGVKVIMHTYPLIWVNIEIHFEIFFFTSYEDKYF